MPSKKRSWVLAPTVVIHGTSAGPADGRGAGAAVPGGRGHPDAGVRGEQVGEGVAGRDQVGATADRVVDDVDAVGHGLVDRRRQVGGEAAEVAEALVGDDVGPRGDAGDLAEVATEDRRLDAGVAGGGGGRVGAVAVVVASGVELVRRRPR